MKIRNFFYCLGLSSSLAAVPLATAGEGWYLGAGGLWTDFSVTVESNEVQPDPVFNKDLITSTETSEDKFGGQVHAGYQWLLPLQLGMASFAIEAAGEFQSINVSVTGDLLPGFTEPAEISMTFEDSFVLSAKPGFFLTNNLLVYGEVGGVYSQIGDIETDAGDTGVPINRYGSYSDEDLLGVRAGAGLNFLVTKSLSIEASWRYTFYPGFDENRVLATSISGNSTEEIDVSDISTQQVFLGFHYYL